MRNGLLDGWCAHDVAGILETDRRGLLDARTPEIVTTRPRYTAPPLALDGRCACGHDGLERYPGSAGIRARTKCRIPVVGVWSCCARCASGNHRAGRRRCWCACRGDDQCGKAQGADKRSHAAFSCCRCSNSGHGENTRVSLYLKRFGCQPCVGQPDRLCRAADAPANRHRPVSGCDKRGGWSGAGSGSAGWPEARAQGFVGCLHGWRQSQKLLRTIVRCYDWVLVEMGGGGVVAGRPGCRHSAAPAFGGLTSSKGVTP